VTDEGIAAALHAAFARSADPVIALDARRAPVYANPRAHELGVATASFPGADPAAIDAALDAALGGAPASFEWGEHGPGGIRARYVASTSALVGAGDAIVGALCVSHDVTARARTIERLHRSERLMVDTQGVAHLGTWEWDLSEPTATWSDELYRIYGLTPEAYTPSYERYLEMVHPDDRARVIEATNRVFEQHVPYSHDERIFRPDGSMRYLHTWAHPVLDEDGTLVRLVGVCQDITDRKLAEEALHRLNVELEQRVAERTHELEVALRDLEAWSAMASHDLRSPLAVLQVAVDAIARVDEASGARRFLPAAQRAIDSMSALIDSLLRLGRVRGGALAEADVDLSALAAEIVAELRAAEPARPAEITIEPGLRCRGDLDLLRSALANLIGNAWKYAARAPVTRIAIVRDGGALIVRDNGIGFAMDDAARLFAPFERLDNARDFAGHGVGLAIVQRIALRHGGRVEAHSQPGEGATFRIALPAARWR
jgi:PAS domain S-box-containing protein